jgi:hypothetical protein
MNAVLLFQLPGATKSPHAAKRQKWASLAGRSQPELPYWVSVGTQSTPAASVSVWPGHPGTAAAATSAVFEEIPASSRIAALVVDLWLRAGHRPPAEPPCDAYVKGRIGNLDLRQGCYSTYEACTIAAQDLAKTGRARQAVATFRGGATMREILRSIYRIEPQSEVDAPRERRAFVRMLRREERQN